MAKYNQSRRSFLVRLFPHSKPAKQTEKITMLTADGKLVYVDKPDITAKSQKKTSNAEILRWVQSHKSDKRS